jgi:hypothetical protein
MSRPCGRQVNRFCLAGSLSQKCLCPYTSDQSDRGMSRRLAMRLVSPLVMRSSRAETRVDPVKAGRRSRGLSTSLTVRRNVTIHDSRATRQRLFVAGVNPFLPPSVRKATSPTFVEVDFAEWLGSIGVKTGSGPEHLEITHVATGHGHALIAYRYEGVESIFAIGRNESGQLGIGYNSQVRTLARIRGSRNGP